MVFCQDQIDILVKIQNYESFNNFVNKEVT